MTRRSLLVAIALAACSGPSQEAPPTVIVPAQPVAPAAPTAPLPVAVESPTPAPPPFDVPQPPAVRPIDPKLPIDGGVLLLGYDAKQAWVIAEGASIVIDRASGCAIESYPAAPQLERIRNTTSEEGAIEALTDASVVTAIRELVGLGRRFGQRTQWLFGRVVWSPDGRHVVVEMGDRLFHSSDGGKTYSLLEGQQGSRHAITPDGKYLLYQRNGAEYVSVPLDRSRGPLPFTKSQGFLLDMTKDARARFWRSDDRSTCLDVFELGKPVRESAACVPLPPAAKKTWVYHEFQSVSPSGNYGVVKWEEGRARRPGGPVALTYVVSLVEMSSQTIVKTVLDVDAFVDDQGNMVTRSVNEGGGDLTQYHPRSGNPKTLGKTSVLAWDIDQKVAILAGPYRKATLEKRKCDLLTFVKTP